ncbi:MULTISPECIES: hypothetical protein [Pseudomonadota]|jgi:hypothetical protein|uniref:hypothetical protein n=1 Tax=Pseudomonadota TaxID=1224 RepID=UPI000AF43CBC|nr:MULTISPECIES: hypothetical protein [unclassified Sphingomonas]MBD8468627.1 hypothetical protein [Sphingomonas sp. CFBP 8765]MDY1008205.1 hypothetical protein [Sphingomonas sp. CFBP9019]
MRDKASTPHGAGSTNQDRGYCQRMPSSMKAGNRDLGMFNRSSVKGEKYQGHGTTPAYI